jgi:hypothetical protein
MVAPLFVPIFATTERQHHRLATMSIYILVFFTVMMASAGFIYLQQRNRQGSFARPMSGNESKQPASSEEERPDDKPMFQRFVIRPGEDRCQAAISAMPNNWRNNCAKRSSSATR